MRLISLTVVEGLFTKQFYFGNGINLIHSQKNSCGKTTLIRLILYALGFNIPSTKKISFKSLATEIEVTHEVLGTIKLFRKSLNQILLSQSNTMSTYALPGELKVLHQSIFNTENNDLLTNILGCFYIDQEKGWTLLNRGTVIGGIHFNIEELLRGLDDIDCSALINKQMELNKELKQYQQIMKISEVQKNIKDDADYNISDFDTEAVSQLEQLDIEYRRLKKESNRIDKVLKDNKRFKSFIEEMKLLVKLPDQNIVPLNSKNIVGYDDNIGLLESKQKFILQDINMILSKIEKLKKEIYFGNEEDILVGAESWTVSFNRKFAQINIDQKQIAQKISWVKREINKLNKEIKIRTKDNNSSALSFYKEVVKYIELLDIDLNQEVSLEYIFTSNLKELSGAVLQKLVFAFKLGYLYSVQKKIGIKLPIIIDSPSGKELDKENVVLMLDLLLKSFPENQIFIASIYDYDWKENAVNKIELKKYLLE